MNRSIYIVLIICLLPFLLNQIGIDFEFKDKEMQQFVFNIIQWTAVCIAMISVIFSLIVFYHKKEFFLLLVIFGFFSLALMKAMQIFMVDRIFFPDIDLDQYLPLNLFFSNLMLSVPLFVLVWFRLKKRFFGARPFLSIACVGLTIFAICLFINLWAAKADTLPQLIYPDFWIPRPYALIPALFFLSSFFILRKISSFFSYYIYLSLIPLFFSQLYLAFGSRGNFDNGANNALIMQVVAFFIPFIGLSIRIIGLHYLQSKIILDFSFELESSLADLKKIIAKTKLDEFNDKQKNAIEIISQAVLHLDKLNEKIKTISVAEVGHLPLELQKVDIQKLLKHSIESIRPLIERKEVMLEVTVPQKPIILVTDKGKMDEIISNILSYSAENIQSGNLFISVNHGKHLLIMKIVDTGPGIDKESLESINQLFLTRTTVEGPYLELYIARLYVDLLEGNMEVKSKLGKGASFQLKFSL